MVQCRYYDHFESEESDQDYLGYITDEYQVRDLRDFLQEVSEKSRAKHDAIIDMLFDSVYVVYPSLYDLKLLLVTHFIFNSSLVNPNTLIMIFGVTFCHVSFLIRS